MTQEDILRRAILNDEFPNSDEFFESDSMAQMVPDRLKFERNAALGAWMSRVSGREVNASAADWQANKDALARGFFKDSAASNVSDEQLHSLVKTHIQTADEAADMAANMALQGKTSFEALKELNTKRGPSLVRPIWDNYTKDLVQRHSALATKLAPYRGIVDSAASQLGKEMEWSVPTTQKFQDVATQLLQVPEEDRNLVISAIGATGGATAEERASYLSKLAGAMGRMTETLGSSSVGTMEQIGTTFDQLAQVPEAIASALSGGVTMQGELASSKERSQALLKAKEDQQAFQILTQQIRQVADSEVSPIKGDNWWSQTGIDVARMAPQVAVTVANPIIGTAANLSYFRATVAAEAKQEDPSLTYQQADTIGALTAPFNAAIETVTALIPFGKVKLPFVQKWLSTATTSVMGTARNLVIRGAFGVPSEMGEEMLQAIAPLWTQELMGELSKDMPGVDWEKRMPDFSKIAAQTWGPALVFGLVGGGAASINDIKQGRALASDRDVMVATGMAPAMADQIATAAESGDWSKADSLFRQEFTSTTKATDEEKTAAVARIIETRKSQDVFRSNRERGADALDSSFPEGGEWTAERARNAEQAIESLSQSRVFRDAEGWAVEDTATNDVVRVGSREEAVGLVFGHLDEQEQRRAQAGAQLWDELYEKGGMGDEALRAESASMDTQKQAARSPEDAVRVARGIETYAQLHGIPLDEARKIVFTVNGFNKDEQIENVRTAVSSVFGRGMNVATVLHETTHGRWRAGLESGRFTHDQGLAWVRLAEQATGIDFLPSKVDSQISESLLDEAIVDVTVADAIGRRKDGGKFSAGLISRGMAAMARGERNATLGKDIDSRKTSRAAGTFATWLKAWKGFWGQVLKKGKALRKAKSEGKLGDDYDAFLDELMEASPQRRHEAAAAKEALEIAQAGNMAFSLQSRAKTGGEIGANGEWYPGGAFIATKDIPKKLREKIEKSASGAEQIEPGFGADKMAVPEPGKLPIVARLVGTYMGPDGALNEQYIAFNKVPPEMADQIREAAKRYRAGERFLDVNEFALIATFKDGARLVKAGLPIPGDLVKRMPADVAALLTKASAASFSLAPRSAQDTEYLAAVESGDLAKAQSMVDEATKEAGINPDESKVSLSQYKWAYLKGLSHRETDTYWSFHTPSLTQAYNAGRAQRYKSWDGWKPEKIVSGWRHGNLPDGGVSRNHAENIAEPGLSLMALVGGERTPTLAAVSHRKVVYAYGWLLPETGSDNEPTIWPSGISNLDQGDIPKATHDPVVYNESGQVIPLSQRFNTESNDIRFSLAPRSLPEVADTILAAQMKKPAFFEAFVVLARRKMEKLWKDGDWRVDKRGIASKRVGFDSRMSDNRSPANIEAERKFRLRSRQRELIDEGMLALAPETLAAYDAGVASLEDVPIVSDMLGKVGKIMSKSAAQKAGKLKTDGVGSAGDYDGAPRLPPAWYAKSGGSMPYEIAQQLSDMGHLKDGYADTLWDALRSAIYSTKSANEGFKKARDAVRKVETDALAQAKKETDTWAKDETAKIPTEKEKQMMALRTLDAILSAFDPIIREKVGGFVKLAEHDSDAAREKEIIRRLAKLEEVIEEEAKKHYAKKIGKMLDRYKSQKDNSGRISGKLISTATEQVDYAAQIADLDVAAQAEKGDALESLIEKSDDAGVVQDALNKLGILRMFETMDLKDSLALESAADWLETTIADGKLGKKIVDESRKEFVDDMREQAQAQVLDGKALNIDDANNLTNVNRAPMLAMAQRLRGMMSEALWATAQRLEIIFGEGSKASEYFAGMVVAAANKSNDIKRAVSAQQREILGVIFGSDSKFTHAKGIAKLQKPRYSGVMVRRPVTKDVTLDMETLTKLADGTMTPETAGIREDELQTALDEWAASDRKRSVTITQVVNVGTETDRYMSELQGIQWRLWWNQADSKKQMERDGWSDESIKQLDAFLSDEAKALGMWISDSYGEAAKMIDPVYRRLFNAPLPRKKGYAPIYRMTLSTSAEVMDLGNSDMNSGLAAGFVMARVNTTAPLLEIDALAAFLSHWENVSHWVSHAELMRDMKAILLDKNVSTAIRQKKGDGALSRLKKDISSIETNGTKGAAEIASISKGWSWLMQYRAFKALSFRVSPIAKQTAAALNPLLADVPAHNYAAGLSRAFTSPQEFAADVAAMWKSDVVQRRIDGGFSAEARMAQQGASMTGSQAIVFMQAGMMPMSQVDGGWTAMGAAVAYDYYKRSYLSQNDGATQEMADAAATARLERMIATSAQPADIVNRSLIERSGNIFARSMAMFVSDQRKALAIEVLAIRKLATGKSKNKALDVQRILVAHFVQSAITQCVAMFLASTLGDDEDEDREWSVKQWALSLSLGPISGLFLVGRGIESIARRMLGLRIFPNNDLAGKAADDLIRGTKSMDELFNPDDAEDVMTSLDALSAAVGSVGSGLFGPAAGAVDVSANLAREAVKIMGEK